MALWVNPLLLSNMWPCFFCHLVLKFSLPSITAPLCQSCSCTTFTPANCLWVTGSFH